MQQHHTLVGLPRVTLSPQRNSLSRSPQRAVQECKGLATAPQQSMVSVSTQPRQPTPLPSAPGSRAMSPMSTASVPSTFSPVQQYSANVPSGAAPMFPLAASSQTAESPSNHIRETVSVPKCVRLASPMPGKEAVVHERSNAARTTPNNVLSERSERGSQVAANPANATKTIDAQALHIKRRVVDRSQSPLLSTTSTVKAEISGLSHYKAVTGVSGDSIPPGPLLRGRLGGGSATAVMSTPVIPAQQGLPRESSAVANLPGGSGTFVAGSQGAPIPTCAPPPSMKRSLSPGPGRRSNSMLLPIGSPQHGSLTVPPRRNISPSQGVVRSISATPLRRCEDGRATRSASVPSVPIDIPGRGSLKLKLNLPPHPYSNVPLPAWATAQVFSPDQSSAPSLSTTEMSVSPEAEKGVSINKKALQLPASFIMPGNSQKIEAPNQAGNETMLRQFLQKPETVRLMEEVMRDSILRTIEGHVEKSVSAMFSLRDQRIEELVRYSQQTEERCKHLLATERQERQQMFKVTSQRHEDSAKVLEGNSSRIEAVSIDVAAMWSRMSSAEGARSLQQPNAPEQFNAVMALVKQERTEWKRSFEQLQLVIQQQKAHFDLMFAEEKARTDAILQESELMMSGDPDSAGATVQVKVFKSMLDQRIKDVACTIDQLIKDFANSLEAERAQRQEGDRLASAMARDLSKYKDRLESLVDEVEATKGLRQHALSDASALTIQPTAAEEMLRVLEAQIHDIAKRLDSFELTQEASVLLLRPDRKGQPNFGKELEELVDRRVKEVTQSIEIGQCETVVGMQASIDQIRDALARINAPSDGSRNQGSEQGRFPHSLKRRPNKEADK